MTISPQLRERLARWIRKTHGALTAPMAICLLTYSVAVQPAYGMTWLKRMRLGFRFWRNHSKIVSGTSWRAHLVMAMKLLEIPPDVKGCVVECGCWKGTATVNLSLICRIVGRKLKVYDSFEGLPPPSPNDPIGERAFGKGFVPGVFEGTLEEVRENLRRYGAIESVEMIKGWFKDTTPHHKDPIALAFWDVDFYASLHDCLINLWPSVIDGGFVFMDEFREIPYCAVFYSEKYWRKYFNCDPPGLIGIGTGVQVGMHYTDPKLGYPIPGNIQDPSSLAYCVKGTRAIWDYYPDEAAVPSVN